MPDQFALRLFHKSDIRADVSFFTPETVTGLTHAEALFLKDSSISQLVLARDARLSGAAILSLKTEIFTSLGFDVYVIPAPASTPYFYHVVRQLKGAAGIMVTASHNPGNYNGEKLVLPGPFPIADNSGLEIIKKYFEKGRRAESATSGRVYFPSFHEHFISSSFAFLSLDRDFQPSFRFAADFLSGSGADATAPVLSRMENARISHFIPDGNFPLGDPNPAKVKLLPEKDEEFILLYDGDGDRVDVILADGSEIPPSVIFTFILPYIAPAASRVGLDPKASPIIREYLKSEGHEPVLVPNGHSRIKGIMKTDGTIGAAAEESGHYYLNEGGIPIENTLIITLSFLMAYERDRKRLDDLIALYSSFRRIREWTESFDSDEKRKQVLATLTDRFVGMGYELTDTLENGEALGTSLLLKRETDGWTQVSLRASDTEQWLARYEVLASDMERAEAARKVITERSS